MTKTRRAAIEARIENLRNKIDEFTLTLSELEASLNTHEYQLIANWRSGGKPEIIDVFHTKKEAEEMRHEYYRSYGSSVRSINIKRAEVEP